MKKLLLSILAVAGFVTVAQANDTAELSAANAANIQGSYTEERAAGTNGENDNGEAAHYQPLTSLEIDNFTFSFAKAEGATEPALYYPMSTSTSGSVNIRVYKKNTMTITAPEGVLMSKIVFTGSNGTANADHTANVGTVSDVSKTEMTWSYAEGTNSVTFTISSSANYRINSMVVTLGASSGDDTPDTPTEPTGVSFTKVMKTANFVSGEKYVIAVGEGVNIIATPLTKAYGYLYTAGVEIEETTLTADEANAFTFTADGDGYNIQDADGYYYYQSGSYNSFNRATEKPDEGAVWTVTIDSDGYATITNTSVNKFVSYSTQYSSFGSYAELADANYMPMLFKKDSQSGVAAIATDNVNAPVVYYNLQGQRVANPENGLFIRVQGSKVEKVAIR
jgi:hypothetical protein